MGTWGSLPWHNDTAADWFAELFDQTKLAERAEKALRLNPRTHYDEIRAAASLVLLLGHTYFWPVDSRQRHQLLAAKRLEDLLKNRVFLGDEETIRAVRAEIAALRGRARGTGPKTALRNRPEEWWRQLS